MDEHKDEMNDLKDEHKDEMSDLKDEHKDEKEELKNKRSSKPPKFAFEIPQHTETVEEQAEEIKSIFEERAKAAAAAPQEDSVNAFDEAQSATLTADERPSSATKGTAEMSDSVKLIIVGVATVAVVALALVVYCTMRRCSSGKQQKTSEQEISKLPQNDSMSSPDKRHKRDNSSAQFINDSSRGTNSYVDESAYNSTSKLKPSDSVIDETKA